MFAQQYDHGVIRRYTIGFGNLFNDIVIQRKSETSGTRIQTLSVPLQYASKRSFWLRLRGDPNLDKQVAITLPAMGFVITGYQYDSSRKLSSTQKNCIETSDGRRVNTQFVPVPYNLQYELNIYSHYYEDITQITEQILPYFRPNFTLNVKVIPDMNITIDVPVNLDSISVEDTYETDFQSRQILIYTLQFTVKGFLYGPIRNEGIITRSIVQEKDLTTGETLARFEFEEVDC